MIEGFRNTRNKSTRDLGIAHMQAQTLAKKVRGNDLTITKNQIDTNGQKNKAFSSKNDITCRDNGVICLPIFW